MGSADLCTYHRHIPPVPGQEHLTKRHGITHQEDPRPEFPRPLRVQRAFVRLRMPAYIAAARSLSTLLLRPGQNTDSHASGRACRDVTRAKDKPQKITRTAWTSGKDTHIQSRRASASSPRGTHARPRSRRERAADAATQDAHSPSVTLVSLHGTTSRLSRDRVQPVQSRPRHPPRMSSTYCIRRPPYAASRADAAARGTSPHSQRPNNRVQYVQGIGDTMSI